MLKKLKEGMKDFKSIFEGNKDYYLKISEKFKIIHNELTGLLIKNPGTAVKDQLVKEIINASKKIK